MTYGYCRCSTNETKQDINRQKRELITMGATADTIYMEYESGTKQNRPELLKMLAAIKEGDTIVTTEISRITRSTKQLCDIIELIQQRRVCLIIKNSVTIDCSKGEIDPMTKAFLQMAGVFAELERGMICDRVKSGLANARAKGKQLGRPTLTIEGVPAKVKTNFDRYRNGELSKTEYAKICDISRPTLDKYIAIMTDK
ncbi:MAG: recombinase family protein [Acutalibacteraceae bacterium]|nr:recombinase family protein [Acutalibacteraceae bacterium]